MASSAELNAAIALPFPLWLATVPISMPNANGWVGNGDIDYGEIFKYANVAGMKHFAIEQDSAAEWEAGAGITSGLTYAPAPDLDSPEARAILAALRA